VQLLLLIRLLKIGQNKETSLKLSMKLENARLRILIRISFSPQKTDLIWQSKMVASTVLQIHQNWSFSAMNSQTITVFSHSTLWNATTQTHQIAMMLTLARWSSRSPWRSQLLLTPSNSTVLTKKTTTQFKTLQYTISNRFLTCPTLDRQPWQESKERLHRSKRATFTCFKTTSLNILVQKQANLKSFFHSKQP